MSVDDTVRQLLGEDYGPISAIARLPGGRNDVCRVLTVSGQSLMVKLYRQHRDSIKNREIEMHACLLNCPAVRRPLACSPPDGGHHGYLVTEYVEGQTLLQRLARGPLPNARAIFKQVFEYVSHCAALPATGYGNLTADLRGESSSWANFLASHLGRTGRRLEELTPQLAAPLRNSLAVLYEHLERDRGAFDAVRSVLVPIDLNLGNFLLTHDEQIVVLDLEAFWSADRMLALGEWGAHTWGTPAYTHFAFAWGPISRAERRRLHFYALLATLDIQLFIAENASSAVTDACPWGNTIRFADLAATHRAMLAAENMWTPEELLETCPQLGVEWGIKLGEGLGLRTTPIAETLARVLKIQTAAGITRVADVTALDNTGIPVYQAIRPDAESDEETFTVFSGKGTTADECKTAAIAEAIERFCAERSHYASSHIVSGSLNEVARSHAFVDPRAFNLPASVPFDENNTLEWMPACDLITGVTYLVPACAVFYPYANAAPFRYFTTGLAAGNTLLEAIAHGLSEVIERDAAALNLIVRDRPAVSPTSIDSEIAQHQIDRLTTSGLHPIIRSITSPDIPIAVFSVICEDHHLQHPMYVSGGYGAHPDKEIAVVRALIEAAASRTGTISGSREDLAKYGVKRSLDYAEFRRRFAYWFDETSFTVDYRELPSTRSATVLEDLAQMIAAVRAAGFTRQLVVDLSHEELGLRVAKVIVPGIERYSFRMRYVGKRARSRYRARYRCELPLAPLQEPRP
jgi:ribosomal protein S12 methylthiotransferase accessory factor